MEKLHPQDINDFFKQVKDNTTGELLDKLANVIENKNQLTARVKVANEAKGMLERLLLQRAEEAGVQSFSTPTLSVTIKDKVVAKYSPPMFDDILAWAVKTNNQQIIQRRFSNAKVESLAVDGVPLPDGLTLEVLPTVSSRRK